MTSLWRRPPPWSGVGHSRDDSYAVHVFPPYLFMVNVPQNTVAGKPHAALLPSLKAGLHDRRNFLRGLGILGISAALVTVPGCKKGPEQQQPIDVVIFYDREACQAMATEMNDRVVEFTDPQGQTVYLLGMEADRLQRFVEEATRRPVTGQMTTYPTREACETATKKKAQEMKTPEGTTVYVATPEPERPEDRRVPVTRGGGGGVVIFPHYIYHPMYAPVGGGGGGGRSAPMTMSVTPSTAATTPGMTAARPAVAMRATPPGGIGRGGFGGGGAAAGG